MFTSFARPDHSNLLLRTPEQQTISLADAQALRHELLKILPSGSRLRIFAAAAGGPGADYDEKWITENTADRNRPAVFRLVASDVSIGQEVQATEATLNARALAEMFLRSPRLAAENVMTSCGASQADIDRWHLDQPSVVAAIEALYRR